MVHNSSIAHTVNAFYRKMDRSDIYFDRDISVPMAFRADPSRPTTTGGSPYAGIHLLEHYRCLKGNKKGPYLGALVISQQLEGSVRVGISQSELEAFVEESNSDGGYCALTDQVPKFTIIMRRKLLVQYTGPQLQPRERKITFTVEADHVESETEWINGKSPQEAFKEVLGIIR